MSEWREVQASSAGADQTEYAVDAFRAELDYVWGATQFASQIPDMCHARALAASIKRSPINIRRSRRLLYHYLTECDKSSDQAMIHKLYKQLPVANFLKKYLSNICTAFNEPPRRSFGEKGSQDKIWTPIYQTYGLNRFYRKAHRDARVLEPIAMRPVVRRNRLSIQTLTPDLYRVVVDPTDPKEPIEMWWPETVDGELQLCRMTASTIEYRRRDDPEVVIGQPIPNPWGEIHWVFLRLEEEEDFWGGGDFTLVEQRMESNSQRFYSNIAAKFDTYGVMIGKNLQDSDDDEGDVYLGPGAVILRNEVSSDEGEDPPSLEVVNGTSQHGAVDELRRNREQDDMRQRGIPASNLTTNPGVSPSGVARQAERMELDDVRREDTEALQDMERQMKRKIALAINDAPIWVGDELVTNVPVDDQITVQYRRERILMEPKDKLALDKELVTEGILPVTALVNEFGDEGQVDDELAIAIIRKNRALARRAAQDSDEAQAPPVNDNELRGSVGGATSIGGLQAQVYSGAIPREAAIGSMKVLFGMSQEEAEMLFPIIQPPEGTPPAPDAPPETTNEPPPIEEDNGDAEA